MTKSLEGIPRIKSNKEIREIFLQNKSHFILLHTAFCAFLFTFKLSFLLLVLLQITEVKKRDTQLMRRKKTFVDGTKKGFSKKKEK